MFHSFPNNKQEMLCVRGREEGVVVERLALVN